MPRRDNLPAHLGYAPGSGFALIPVRLETCLDSLRAAVTKQLLEGKPGPGRSPIVQCSSPARHSRRLTSGGIAVMQEAL
jgi:hypothetical protein